MGLNIIHFGIISGTFAIIFFIVPLFIPRGKNRELINVCIRMAAFWCWLFWLLCYLNQMNPLLGPSLGKVATILVAKSWCGGFEGENVAVICHFRSDDDDD